MFPRVRGIGLVGAISLIVITALLAVAINRTVLFGSDATVVDVLNHKSLLAANAGAQLALNRIFAPEGVGSCVNANLTLAQIPGFEFCTAVTTCATDTARGRTYFTIESTGSCTAASLTTSRGVLVRARQ
jgi:hypothetical protein